MVQSLDQTFLKAYRFGSLVIWPPDEVRCAVNSLRRRFDPASATICEAHITLTWPFIDKPGTRHWRKVNQVATEADPFQIEYGPLGSFFPYPCIYLQIEPATTIRRLHTALHNTGLFDDRSPHTRDNFVPHMSITDGYPDPEQTSMILNGLQGFEPVGSFECGEISWIVPDRHGVFHLRCSIPLSEQL